jgi:uncharacterized membrane protein YjjP (DUF1212 family)
MSGLMHWIDGVIDVVLSPALWLSVVIAVVCGVLFYAWRGGGARQFGQDVVAGLLGFGMGQLIGAYLQLDLPRLGEIQVVAGIAGAILALFIGRLIWRQSAGRA